MKKQCKLGKNLLLSLIGLLLVVSISFADMAEPLNVTIDNTNWTAISLDGDTTCKAYVFQSRDGTDFKIKRKAASTNYYTIRNGIPYSVTFERDRKPTTLFYAQSTSGEIVIEVFVVNDK